jgi:hypothetical protein
MDNVLGLTCSDGLKQIGSTPVLRAYGSDGVPDVSPDPHD